MSGAIWAAVRRLLRVLAAAAIATLVANFELVMNIFKAIIPDNLEGFLLPAIMAVVMAAFKFLRDMFPDTIGDGLAKKAVKKLAKVA